MTTKKATSAKSSKPKEEPKSEKTKEEPKIKEVQVICFAKNLWTSKGKIYLKARIHLPEDEAKFLHDREQVEIL